MKDSTVGSPRTDGCLICEEAVQPFAVRCSLSKTGQRRFEFGSFLPWQNVFKQRKWISHKPWQPQNNNWQWHFTAGRALTGGTTAATILWSNVSLFLSRLYDTACLVNNLKYGSLSIYLTERTRLAEDYCCMKTLQYRLLFIYSVSHNSCKNYIKDIT